MLERDSVYNSVLDRIDRLEAQIEDLRDVARPGEVITVEQPEWQALAGWVSTGTVLRDVTGKIVLDPTIPRIRIGAGGYIESEDFVAGVSGFQINGGTAEFNDVVVRGTIYATLGAIGGWIIGTHTLTADSGAVGLNSEATGGVDWRIWAGHATPGSAPFRVDESGNLVASSANITGTIDANAGHLGSLDVDGVITVGAVAPYIQIDGVNKRIRTSTYSSGFQGFTIESDGSAEFNNVAVRGELHTAVLVYGEQHVTAGTMVVVKSAGKLRADVTTVASPTTFNVDIEDPDSGHAQLFAVSDILRIKDGLGDNWLTVQSVSDQTTFYRYVCVLSSGTAGTFRAGAAVADYGQSGGGGLMQTADLTNAPYLSIFTHAGAPWTTLTERLRLGNLAGWQGAGLTGYGIAIGDYSGNEFAYYTPGSGLVVRGTIRADDGYLATLSVTGTLTLSGSGKLITAASPAARIELSTTELAGYSDATTKQFYISASDGRAYAGGGNISLYADGMAVTITSGFANSRKIRFMDGATERGYVTAMTGPAGGDSWVYILAQNGLNDSTIVLSGADGVRCTHGLYVGGVSSAPTDNDIIADGGIYLGRNADPGNGNVAYTGTLKSYKNSTEYTVYGYYPYATALTSTSYDGDETFTAGNTWLDLSSVFGAPAYIEAAHMLLIDKSSTPTAYIGVGPSSSAPGLYYLSCRAQVADIWNDLAGNCVCDSNGDIYFGRGGGTHYVHIRVLGYYI